MNLIVGTTRSGTARECNDLSRGKLLSRGRNIGMGGKVRGGRSLLVLPRAPCHALHSRTEFQSRERDRELLHDSSHVLLRRNSSMCVRRGCTPSCMCVCVRVCVMCACMLCVSACASMIDLHLKYTRGHWKEKGRN